MKTVHSTAEALAEVVRQADAVYAEERNDIQDRRAIRRFADRFRFGDEDCRVVGGDAPSSQTPDDLRRFAVVSSDFSRPFLLGAYETLAAAEKAQCDNPERWPIYERMPARSAASTVKPSAWEVWWGIGEMSRAGRDPFRSRAEAEAFATTIKSNTEVRPLYAAPTTSPNPIVAENATTQSDQFPDAGKMVASLQLKPSDDWHEDMGDVLWWRICGDGKPMEHPWVGSPLSCGYAVEAHTTTRIISHLNQESDPEPTIERINVGGWIDDYFTHFSEIPRVTLSRNDRQTGGPRS